MPSRLFFTYRAGDKPQEDSDDDNDPNDPDGNEDLETDKEDDLYNPPPWLAFKEDAPSPNDDGGRQQAHLRL